MKKCKKGYVLEKDCYIIESEDEKQKIDIALDFMKYVESGKFAKDVGNEVKKNFFKD